jgi:hypothetical protein
VIMLDRTADGYGWFVDPTPGDDSEFGPGTVKSPAHGHIDLLSVVAHELGHLLGYGESDGNDVTGEYLAPGVRHVPAAIPSPLAQGPASSNPASLSGVTPSLRMGLAPLSPQSPSSRSVASPAPHGAERGMLLADSGGLRRAVLPPRAVDSVLVDLGALPSLLNLDGQDLPSHKRARRPDALV